MMRFCDNIRYMDRWFTPKERGCISMDEICKVNIYLEVGLMNNEELCHMRNACVSYFSHEKGEDGRMTPERMDKMSAVVCAIDHEKWMRGMEV